MIIDLNNYLRKEHLMNLLDSARQTQGSRKHLKPIALYGAISLLVAMGLTGCGGGGGTGSGSGIAGITGTTGNQADITFLTNYMRDNYLWLDNRKSIDLTTLKTPEEALEALRVPQDKFSNIGNAAEFNSLFDEGTLTAFGIRFRNVDNIELVLLDVQLNSPAAAAGLKRGDRITAIEGSTIAQLSQSNALDAAFGPVEVGVAKTFSVIALGKTTASNIRLVKSNFSVNFVPVKNTFTVTPTSGPAAKTSYITFNQFTRPGANQWAEAIQAAANSGATQLVLDLRFNGGGYLDVVTDFVSALVPSGNANKVYLTSEFNAANSFRNISYRINSNANAGRFTKVAILTSKQTCSASEALMVALEPYVQTSNLVTVGQTTCGKPVSFSPFQRNGKIYNIVNARYKNAAGKTDFFEGLAPKCEVIDDPSKALGSEQENLLGTALSYFKNGTCPAIASATAAEKSAKTESFGAGKLAPIGVQGLTEIY